MIRTMIPVMVIQINYKKGIPFWNKGKCIDCTIQFSRSNRFTSWVIRFGYTES